MENNIQKSQNRGRCCEERMKILENMNLFHVE